MAHHASAIKRIRQRVKRDNRNRLIRKTVRTQMKQLRIAIRDGDKETAETLLRPTISKLDKAVTKGIVHWRTAARTISRLSHAVAKLS